MRLKWWRGCCREPVLIIGAIVLGVHANELGGLRSPWWPILMVAAVILLLMAFDGDSTS